MTKSKATKPQKPRLRKAQARVEPPLFAGTTDRDFTEHENSEMARIANERHNIVNDIAKEIGLFLFEFKRLEQALDYANGTLLTIRNYSAMTVLGDAIAIHKKITLMAALINMSRMSRNIHKSLKDIPKQIEKLNNERVRFVHGELVNPSYIIKNDRLEISGGWRVYKTKLGQKTSDIIPHDTPHSIRQLRFDCISVINAIFLHIPEYESWRLKILVGQTKPQKEDT